MSKKSTNLCSGFLISYDWLPALESLSADDFQTLLFALIRRQKDGEPFPEFSNATVSIYAKMIEPTIKRRLDGQSGGNKANENTTEDTMVVTTADTNIGTAVDTMVGSKVKKSKVEKSIVDDNEITTTQHARPTNLEVAEYFGQLLDEDKAGIQAWRWYQYNEQRGWDCLPDWKTAAQRWIEKI
jgi:hypothetical protein